MRHSLRQQATSIVLLLGALTLLTARLPAGEHGCAHCGCQPNCQKVCRLVREDKKVELVCWGCKHEEFCIPGPSKPGCKHSETVCDACAQKDADPSVCSQPKEFSWTDWIPGCASVHTRVKLMKRTEVKVIPSYKWVVEDICPACCEKCASAVVASDAPVPPPPSGVKVLKGGAAPPSGPLSR